MLGNDYNYFVATEECGCVFAAVRTDHLSYEIADVMVAEWVRSGLTVKRVTRIQLRKMLKRAFSECNCFIPF